MATYKVLQDIEAEDTLIGPLTLRQCLYAAIAVIGMYLSFVVISKGAPFLVLFLLPFIAFGAFFAFPWSKQQSNEVWALAKVRFYLKPRKRIWNQSGVRDIVQITAPKAIKRAYTNNLSETEVKSRLKALADTIDSRGWAIKNVDLSYYSQVGQNTTNSDRLLNTDGMPREVPGYDTTATADIFDVQNNPVAQKFNAMMAQSADNHRQQLMQQMNQPQLAAPAPQQALQAVPPQSNPWHMRTIAPPSPAGQASAYGPQQPQYTGYNAPAGPYTPQMSQYTLQPVTAVQQPSAVPAAAPAQPAVPDYSNLRLPAPTYSQPAVMQAPPAPENRMTGPTNPAILELANNNDLNVATLAREAQARNPDPPDEVVVSLH